MIHDAQELLLEEEIPQRRRTVLIVDDDEGQTAALAWRLQNQGFDTLTAHTGAAGVELARHESPDVILLDLQLPDADGLELCQQLGDDPATCGTPVIIISGQERMDVVRRARAAGCDYYLRKPYDPSVVLMLIERALDRLGEW